MDIAIFQKTFGTTGVPEKNAIRKQFNRYYQKSVSSVIEKNDTSAMYSSFQLIQCFPLATLILAMGRKKFTLLSLDIEGNLKIFYMILFEEFRLQNASMKTGVI